MSKSKAYTAAECRAMFLNALHAQAEFWASLPGKTPLEIAEGVAFSAMVMIDGGSMSLPAFRVLTDPHPEDEAFHKGEGERWWPALADITKGAQLHEEFCHPPAPRRGKGAGR